MSEMGPEPGKETSYKNIFESHAHYDDPRFVEDQSVVLCGLAKQGVRYVMNVGADMESSRSSVALAEQYDFIYASVGVHPHDAKNAPEDLEEQLTTLVKNHPKVRAIGEIGLDYHYDFSPREEQKKVFERQLALAKGLELPVIIHSREAAQETYDMLAKHRPEGVIHSFSGSGDMAAEYVKLGFYLGFTGVLTFKNARRALEAVEATPLERLLVETDCPYMAPVPHRGKRSDSGMIPHIVAVMAEIKGKTVQEMLDVTFENAARLYRI